MAVAGRKARLHFLVVFLVMLYTSQPAACLQEYLGSCGLTIDLLLTPNIHSAILRMPMPDSMDKYQDPARPINCDVIISFTSGMNLLLELYFLDIMPRSADINTCTTGLEIFDQTNRKYYGGRICMEAWQWEERHREKKQEKVVVQNSPITFRLVSEAPYRGEGFKLHFSVFRPYWPCYTQEFKCQQIQRCVNYDLTCDGWDDCEDYSDERWEAGCALLTASEICALIMGVVLLLGTVAQIVIFCFTYRRLRQEYGMRSQSKFPIVEDKFNMEPVFGVGRSYNSQESIPSRYSRSTAVTGARQDSDTDTIDKADLEKPDRQELLPLTGSRAFNKAGDNMSERSYRSNPRRTVAQSLGSVAPSDPVKKSGQYSYSSRKGRSSSQSSLARDKTEPGNIHDTNADRGSLDKERFDSRERLSDKNRRYNSKRDLDSDSNEYDDRDRYDDRRRRSSKEPDRRKSDRYSDDESDSDRDRRRRRRRRRRSYDSYSDDSDYEYERKRHRRSRSRYSDEDEDESDRGRDKERDRSYRKGSRERNRDRYKHDSSDDLDDTDKDQGKDVGKDRYRRQSRDRDRERYRDSYDEDRSYRKRQDDDDDDEYGRSGRRRRRGPSAERDRLSGDLSRNGRRSRSHEILTAEDLDMHSVALPMPPPYTEEDPRHQRPAFSSNQSTSEQSLPLPPADLIRATEEVPSQASRSTHRNQGKSGPNPSPVVDRAAEQYPSSEHLKRAEQQNPKVPSVEYRHRQAPVSKPPPPGTDARQNEKPSPKEISDADRRKSNDDRRERYSRSRWTPKKKSQDSPPPEYEDVAPKSTFVGISYREESV